MLSGEIAAAIESLERLENHYQNEYEQYLAKAMTAKAHRERIEVLLRDLDHKIENAIVESSLQGRRRDKDVHLLEARSERTDEDSKREKSENPLVSNYSHSELEVNAVASFLELSKTLMPAIKEIFESEPNKTLHLSYLQKILNSKLNLQLSGETVKLYLNQAIERDYCHLDSYDRECYVANESVGKSEPLIDSDGDEQPVYSTNGNDRVHLDEAEFSRAKSLASSSTEKVFPKNIRHRKLHNLPSSSKLKVTLLETVKGFLKEYSSDLFSTQDIIDYLYSKKQ